MLVIMLLVLVVGTALDLAPTILILSPVLMPIIREAGIDPVYFGVIFVMNSCIGLITPPVGVVLNVVSGVGARAAGQVIVGVSPSCWRRSACSSCWSCSPNRPRPAAMAQVGRRDAELPKTNRLPMEEFDENRRP